MDNPAVKSFQNPLDALNGSDFSMDNDYKGKVEEPFNTGIDTVARANVIRKALRATAVTFGLLGAATLSIYVIEVPLDFNFLYIAIPAGIAFCAIGAVHRFYGISNYEDAKESYQEFFNAAVREIINQVDFDDSNNTKFVSLLKRIEKFVSELEFSEKGMTLKKNQEKIPDFINQFSRANKVTVDRIRLKKSMVKAIGDRGVENIHIKGGVNDGGQMNYMSCADMNLEALLYEYIVDFSSLTLEGLRFETRHLKGDKVNEEETGLVVVSVEELKKVTWSSGVFEGEGIHFLSLFLLASEVVGEPVVREPEKCACWEWFDWNELPEPLFLPLDQVIDEVKELVLNAKTEGSTWKSYYTHPS